MNGEKMVVQVLTPDVAVLTVLQYETVKLLVAGHSQTDIARKFGISRTTVSNRVARLCQKLNVANERALIAHAVRTGLVE